MCVYYQSYTSCKDIEISLVGITNEGISRPQHFTALKFAPLGICGSCTCVPNLQTVLDAVLLANLLLKSKSWPEFLASFCSLTEDLLTVQHKEQFEGWVRMCN